MRRILPLLMAAALAPTASADVVLNELLPNPSGDDVGTERIEIYNTGPDPVDVTGWAIDDAATIDEAAVRARIPEDFDTSVCPASALIQPGEFRVVKGQSQSPFLNNTGDDVYLITDRTAAPNVVDVVTYGNTTGHVAQVWACVPDGSEIFDWRSPSFCGSNGGEGDVTSPDAITDLAAAPGAYPGEILLTWTATGDDGQNGTASEYKIKVSDLPIDSGSFDGATDLDFWINAPVPSPAGTPESFLVAGLDPSMTFFFAVKAVDDASNQSGVSNSPGSEPAQGDLLSTETGFTTYFGNLHSHTAYSDGDLTPADAYDYARYTAQTPLDFLAVTDHNHGGAGMSLPNYHLGLAEAAAANEDGAFVAIYGQEWGLAAYGHVNLFESPSLFGWEGGNYDVFVAEGDYTGLYEASLADPPAAYPAVALWCHPQTADFDSLERSAASDELVTLICLVNGPAQSTATDESDVGNTGFDDTYQDALRMGHRVSPTADQDNHNANWGASTQSRTGILATELTKSALFDALSQGRNYATQDHNAFVGFSAEGRVMGTAFASGPGIRIAVEVADADPEDVIDQIELYRGITGQSHAVRVAFNVGNTRLDWRETDAYAVGTEVHYYVRARQGDAQQIWTAPVYVTYDGSSSVAGAAPSAARLRLLSLRPNPMGAAAAIRFALARSGGAVTLDVLDVRGRLIRRLAGGPLPGGEHGLDWDGLAASGGPAPPGVYFIRLASPDLGIATAKLVILR